MYLKETFGENKDIYERNLRSLRRVTELLKLEGGGPKDEECCIIVVT